MTTTGAMTWRPRCRPGVPPNWSARPGQTPALAGAVRELMVDPLEVNWLQVYPQLEGITREGGRYSVSISLREAPQ